MKITDIFDIPAPEKRIPVPYVIAEAGVNHEGSMDIARRLIDEAAEGGADAIKFQTYKAATLASKDSPAYWDTSKEPTRSQYELFKRHDSFWKNEFEALKKHCDAAGIAFLSTPFDVESAHFFNDLMDVFKISSSDITNKPFIRILCDFRKPILLSTGAAHLHEITEAVEWIEEKGNKLALLHCVLNYPTADENAALGMIPALKRHFPQHVIGYSDHTLPQDMHILETATLLGARVLEKTFQPRQGPTRQRPLPRHGQRGSEALFTPGSGARWTAWAISTCAPCPRRNRPGNTPAVPWSRPAPCPPARR